MRLIGIAGKAKSGKDEFCNILCKTYGFKHISFATKIKELGIKYFGLIEEECCGNKTKASRIILQGIGSSVRTKLFITITVSPDISSRIGESGFPLWVEDIATSDFGVEFINLKNKKKRKLQTLLSNIKTMFDENYNEFTEVSEGYPEDVWINYLVGPLHRLEDGSINNTVYVVSDVRFPNEKNYIQESGGKVAKIVRIDKPKIEAGETHSSETALDDETNFDFIVTNEHRSDWQDRLVLSAANMVRKFVDSGFLTEEDKKKFLINIDEY